MLRTDQALTVSNAENRNERLANAYLVSSPICAGHDAPYQTNRDTDQQNGRGIRRGRFAQQAPFGSRTAPTALDDRPWDDRPVGTATRPLAASAA